MKKVFDKSLPALPDRFWENVDGAFNISDSMFDVAARAAAETLRAEFPNPDDARKFLSGQNSVGGQLAVLQAWKKAGERLVAVDGSVLTDAENTDCLQSIKGEELKQTIPSFGLWFPRRVRDSMSHFQLVRHYAADDLLSDPGSIEYMVGGKRRLARFQSGNGFFETQTVVGLIASTQYHSYESTAGVPLVSIDGLQCVGANGLIGRGTPKKIIESEIVRADRGILETFVVPIYEGRTLLDSFCSTLYQDEAAEMRKMYLSNREPETPLEQSRQGFLTSLNVLSTMIQIMSSYPEYLQTKIVTSSGPKPGNPKKKKIESLRIQELRTPVVDDDRSGGTDHGTGDGTTKRSHWRRGHWRRQAHAENWRRANPDRSTVNLPDGREAHQTWIKPIWIGGAK